MQEDQKFLSEELRDTILLFWDAVPPVWHEVRNHIRGVAVDRMGITVEQFHILRRIRNGCGSVSDLAAEKHISRSAISQAVDLLVGKGLVTRTENAADRRFVQLDLTPEGSARLSDVFDENRAWMQSKLAALDTQELACVEQGLALLKKAFIQSAQE